jgi:pimeloyl-ACP methyl ester carboxylesterase
MHQSKLEQTCIAGARGQIAIARWTPATMRSATPIILLHDSLGCVALWREFPGRLAEACGRPVVAYDRTGFGNSSAHSGLLSMNFIAEEATGDFATVLQHIDAPRFSLFGHSVGGGMAVHCAALYVARCDFLMTESAQAFVEDRTLAGIRAAQTAFTDASQLKRLAKYHGEKAQWVLNAWIDTWLHPGFGNWSLKSTLPLVQCPVLAIHGDQDEYGSIEHPRTIVDLAGQGGHMEMLSGVGHVPHRENCEQVVRLVSRYLSEAG